MKIVNMSAFRFSLLLIPVMVILAALTVTTAKSSAAATCKDYEFGYGSSGQCVKDIQYIVGQWTTDHPVIDGIFGPQTKSAVELYQQNRDLSVDGIVGPNTWAQLCFDVNSEWRNPTAVWYAHNAGCE